jgi:hypothetical protein
MSEPAAHIVVQGLGTTGFQVVRHLQPDPLRPVWVHDPEPARRSLTLSSFPGVRLDRAEDRPDLVVLALPGGLHGDEAERALGRGAHVVSLSDHPGDVERLLSLDAVARAAGRTILVGAGFAPGFSCLLARHAANALDVVDSVSVAKAGTGGPMCARLHHRALKLSGAEWLDGVWQWRRGGSGRELDWFPEPTGARDTYRAWLADPVLLQRCFPDAGRISARRAATRRDRLTSRLPMLRKPHPDGGPGALRVELRGRLGRAVETIVYGLSGHPSVIAGAVAAEAARWLLRGGIASGALGMGEIDEPLALLNPLYAKGFCPVTYESSR